MTDAPTPELVWSDNARLTFDRMPNDVQTALLTEFPCMISRYAPLYHRRPPDLDSVGTIAHIQLPDWNIWLRIDTGYLEDDGEPVLFINELDELTQIELEASVAAARSNPNLFR